MKYNDFVYTLTSAMCEDAYTRFRKSLTNVDDGYQASEKLAFVDAVNVAFGNVGDMLTEGERIADPVGNVYTLTYKVKAHL
jgi:hypothetical protein